MHELPIIVPIYDIDTLIHQAYTISELQSPACHQPKEDERNRHIHKTFLSL